MKAKTQNQMAKDFLRLKPEPKSEKNAYSMKCLNDLRNWMIQNKANLSERKYGVALRIIAEQIDASSDEVLNPGFPYDKKWLGEQLRKNGINKMDKND